MDRLWTDFVNSDYHDWRGGDRSEDRLGKASWQQDFLERWQLNAAVPASLEDELSMRNFRNELLALGARVSSGASLTDVEKQWLNGVMEAGHVRRKLNTIDQELKLQLVAVEAHWSQVMAEVAADFALTLVEGEGGRIRICDNSDCRWMFYDDTRSRTQKYCDDKMCGNLMKVRRFRAKRKSQN
ncbi:putative RNA-binding Zn ribbon-like protein [Paenibacillus xylanexedens]|uniref:CGNR zinc finger domain-containing protein n=1 Tax=Paenibacillus xylanexedens TaxID=528191 RepID=UPI00209C739F|nr:CGNR zinc finger domain-containing protein [Paenibacillus xylanexedens]MCP1427367.1 putative RNA-binding Zn ribbon-like protein [Paenibacillus xylanexedens]